MRVGFHLAEVGIDGRVEHEAVVHDALGVEPDVGLQVAPGEDGPARVARIERAKAAKRGVGDELNVASRRNVFQPGHGGGLVHASLDAVGNPRPEQVFAGARNPAVQNDAPRLLRVGGEAQALERDGHQDEIAARGELGVGAPHRVERIVEAAQVARPAAAVAGGAAFGPERIRLDAERVRGENIGAARVVEGINHDLGRVVFINVFAAPHARADFLRFAIPADEHGVEIARVVSEINIGRLRRRRAIARLALHEVRNFHHLAGNARARLHVFEVGERGRRAHAWNAECGHVSRTGIRRERCRQQDQLGMKADRDLAR